MGIRVDSLAHLINVLNMLLQLYQVGETALAQRVRVGDIKWPGSNPKHGYVYFKEHEVHGHVVSVKWKRCPDHVKSLISFLEFMVKYTADFDTEVFRRIDTLPPYMAVPLLKVFKRSLMGFERVYDVNVSSVGNADINEEDGSVTLTIKISKDNHE
jgi:hypothetical protein